MSTVLYEKNGVITEDRFKKMTEVQWLFHYKEIMNNKKEIYEKQKRDRDDRNDIVEALLSSLEVLGMMTNPELAMAVEKSKKSTDPKDDDLMKYFEEIKDEIPDLMTVTLPQKEKFFLPKRKMKKGITLNIESAGDDISDEYGSSHKG